MPYLTECVSRAYEQNLSWIPDMKHKMSIEFNAVVVYGKYTVYLIIFVWYIES